MFSSTGHRERDHAGRAGQSFTHKLWFRWLLPGTRKLGPVVGPDQHPVVAGLGAGVGAGGPGQQAGLSAGGAGCWVAAVGLPAGVVAGRGGPAELLAAGRLGAPLSATRDDHGAGATHTPHLHRLWTRVAATLVTDRRTLVVPTAQSSTTLLVTWGAVARATLSSTLVFLTGSRVRTLGVTHILFMTRHHTRVPPTAALLLHLLSAGLAGSSMAAHGAGV